MKELPKKPKCSSFRENMLRSVGETDRDEKKERQKQIEGTGVCVCEGRGLAANVHYSQKR